MKAITFLPGRFSDLVKELQAGPFDLNAKLDNWSDRLFLPQLVPYIWTYGDNFNLRIPVKRPEVHEKGILRFADVLMTPQQESGVTIHDVETAERSATEGYLFALGHANDYHSCYSCQGDERWFIASWIDGAPSKCPYFREKNSLWAIPIGGTLTVNWCAGEIQSQTSAVVPIRRRTAGSILAKPFSLFRSSTWRKAGRPATSEDTETKGTPLFRLHFDKEPRIELTPESAAILPQIQRAVA